MRKTCNRCLEKKDISNFYRSTNGPLKSKCKECYIKTQQEIKVRTGYKPLNYSAQRNILIKKLYELGFSPEYISELIGMDIKRYCTPHRCSQHIDG